MADPLHADRILILDFGSQVTQLIARRLRESIRGAPFEMDGNVSLTIRASMGLATFPEDAKSAHEIIRQADEMMYMVKNNNRDSIAVAQQGMVR